MGNTCNANTSHGISSLVSNYILASSNLCQGNTQHGIYIWRSSNCTVEGNVCDDNGADGIRVRSDAGDADNNIIKDNICRGNTSNGIEISEATSDDNHVIGNTLSGNGVNFANAGTGTIIEFNKGYVTENSGIATLLNGNTSIVVAHGLEASPTVILITFAENSTNAIGDWWIDTIGAANFTLNGVDPGASNLDFYWEAKVR